MNKILLRIADLRKKAKVTQQELADSMTDLQEHSVRNVYLQKPETEN